MTARTKLVIPQGVDWSHGWAVTFNGDPIDNTWSARSQIRKKPEAATILHQFAVDIVDSAVVLAVTPAESSAWGWRGAVYDVEIVNADGSVTLRVAQGPVEVSPEVTR